MNSRALIAEFVGTFCLTFAVASSVAVDFPVATPLIAALCLAMFVYTIGDISGCHINPGVTVGLISIKKISVGEGIGYIVVQLLGAACAAGLLVKSGSAGGALPVESTALYVGFAEALGMFFFTFGIAAVVLGKVPEAASGIVIGGSLLLGIVVASHGSAGVLNPAVSIGISNYGISLPYLVGPLVGSVAGFFAGNALNDK